MHCGLFPQSCLTKLGEGGLVGDYNTVGEILEAMLPDMVQVIFPKRFFSPCGTPSLVSYYISSRKLSQSPLESHLFSL